MGDKSPEQKLTTILNVLRNSKIDPAHKTFSNLAAGPLEDLLSDHGEEVIDRIETEARKNPDFNLLLGGVWQGGMSEQIWERVQRARLKVW